MNLIPFGANLVGFANQPISVNFFKSSCRVVLKVFARTVNLAYSFIIVHILDASLSPCACLISPNRSLFMLTLTWSGMCFSSAGG